MKKIYLSTLLCITFIGLLFLRPGNVQHGVHEIAQSDIQEKRSPEAKSKNEKQESMAYSVLPKIPETEKKVTDSTEPKISQRVTGTESLLNSLQGIIQDDVYSVEETIINTENTISKLETRVSLVETSFKYPMLIVEEKGKFFGTNNETVTSSLVQVATHFIVHATPGVKKDELEIKLQSMGFKLKDSISNGTYIVALQDKPTIETHFTQKAALEQLNNLVDGVESDYVLSIVKTPNDSRFLELWGLNNNGQTGGANDKDIDGTEAWEKTTGSKDVLVGVIDTGVDRNHPDLKNNMWTNPDEIAGNGLDDDNNGYIDDVHGWDFANNDNDPFDDNSHGTHCAGTIGGVGNNGTGVTGVCWDVSMVGLKFLNSYGSGALSDAVKAISYATKINVDLTSNSWGGGGFSHSMKNAIDEAHEKGIGFIAAAGNHSANNDKSPSYPSSYTTENIISVGAHDHNGEIAYFSCYGKSSVDLFAPGVRILSTVPGNKYASFQGTSMATPHVSGAYALILAANPKWKSTQVKLALMEGTDKETLMENKCATGGRLNINMALSVAPPQEDLLVLSPTKLDFGEVSPNKSKLLEFTLTNEGEEEATISGAVLNSENYTHNMELPLLIKAGEKITGAISFKSSVKGEFDSTLTLTVDTKNNPTINLPLFALVTAYPDLIVNPENLHFGLRDGESGNQKVILSNIGNDELSFEVFIPKNKAWLTSSLQDSNKYVILPGGTTELVVSASANQMPTEHEESFLLIRSNDPDKPEKKINISAQRLSEQGGLTVRPFSLIFENTFIGQTVRQEISLSNTSTKKIKLDRFSFRNSQFSHGISLPLTLKAGEKTSTAIYFSPSELGTTESSALLLTDENGAKLRTYNVIGRGLVPPHMVINPTALSANLSMNKEKQLPLTISNNGGSTLKWNLKGITPKGGKSLTLPKLFKASHFLPRAKGQNDYRNGIPVSTFGGGPDFHGYLWTDSKEAGGPEHQWIDISKSGILLKALSETDDGYAKVSLPFTMELYGKKFNEVFINSNGYTTFGKGSVEHGHFPLPSTMMPGNLIAPFSMDLNPKRGGEIYVQAMKNEFLIQWNKVKDFAGIGEYTFQASLNQNGVVYFHYQNMSGKTDIATTGIQNETGDTGLLVAYNNKQVSSHSTIRVSTAPKWLHSDITNGELTAGKSTQVPLIIKSGKILTGKYDAIIEVKSNDPNSLTTFIPVSITVQAERKMEVTPTALNFSNVAVGETKSDIVKVTNVGNAVININNLSLENGVFSTSLSESKVEPGKSLEIPVSFEPNEGKQYQQEFLIKSNADQPETKIALSGTGIASPALKVAPEILTMTVKAGERKDGIIALDNTNGKAQGKFTLQSIKTKTSGKQNFSPLESTEIKSDPFVAEHRADRLIVRFKEGHNTFADIGKMNALVTIERDLAKARNPDNGKLAMNQLNLSLVRTKQSADLKAIAQLLEQDSAVLYAEPDYIVSRTEVTNDPLLSQQWALQKISASQAWEVTKGSSKVKVAIIDSGIDYTHPDLKGNIWVNPGETPNNGKDDDGNGYIDDVYGWDFANNDKDPMDGHGHGTHVAGTIAASTNNGQKIAGVAWHAKMAGLKFLSDSGSGSTSGAIEAIAYSTAMGFKVSNNSWGGGGYSRSLKEVIEKAGENGQLFCAAAGNSKSNNDKNPHYPSNYDCENIISVAASDRTDKLASFSCYGKNSVDLAAPGVGILSLLPNNRTASWSGTSMATPHVAGAATLIFAINPNATHSEVKNAIMTTVDPIPEFNEKMITGGRINVASALGQTAQSWLTVSPQEGTVEEGSTTNLTFSVDATKFNAGKKEAIATFSTNDPKVGNLEIPVNVNVIGEPEIVVSAKELNFGTLWQNNKKTLNLTISNLGTDELIVEKISCPNKRFVSNKNQLVIKTGEESTIEVTANAMETGNFGPFLMLTSNDSKKPTVKVKLNLSVISPPLFKITPKEISVIMEPNQAESQNIAFSNNGGATGRWEALFRETNQNKSRTRDLDSLLANLNKPGRAPEFSSPQIPFDGEVLNKSDFTAKAATRITAPKIESLLEVAILGANSTAKNNDVAQGIIDSKRFSGVTIIDIGKITPTLTELMAFDSVIVYRNYGYQDSKKLGDNLADYADQGGGVVTMAFESSKKFEHFKSLSGRWATEKYGVFEESSTDTRNWNTDGSVLQENHPLVQNIDTFEGYFRLNKTDLRSGAQIVSKWKDGLPLVSYRNDIANIVDLNFYPVSNKIMTNGWKSETDGFVMLANSLEWAAKARGSEWITASVLKGTVPVASEDIWEINLSSNGLEEGKYTAEIDITTNEPVNNFHSVKVLLEVKRNKAPVPQSTVIQTKEDTPMKFSLKATDPESDRILYTLTKQPSNGTLSGKVPNLTYHPKENFHGVDSLKFKVSDAKNEGKEATVTFEVSSVNDAPWAKPEKIVSQEDDLVVIDPLFGDPDGDPLTIRISQNPSNGLAFQNGSEWLFFPDTNYNGIDEIRFEVSDGKLKTEAVISLTIESVNDAPIAWDTNLIAEEGKRLDFDLNATDVDGDQISYNIVSHPAHGRLKTSSGKWSYTPFENYNGNDSFTFRASDGKTQGNLAKVSFNVQQTNQAPQVSDANFAVMEDETLPIKLIAGDPDGDKLSFRLSQQPENGKLVGNGPEYIYIPNENFFGNDSFKVVASDGKTESNGAQINLTVTGKNDAPSFTSLGTLSTGYRETPYRLKLKTEDIDGDSLKIKVATQPANGTCVIEKEELVYLPDPGFTGVEKLEIEVSDGKLASNSALQFPIMEHPNAIGIYVDFIDGGEKEQAFVTMVYELNEVLKETANHIIRMDQSKTSLNHRGSLSEFPANAKIMTLEEWKDLLPSMDPKTNFSFHQELENGSNFWKVASFLAPISSTDTELDNNNTYGKEPEGDQLKNKDSSSLDTKSSTDTYIPDEGTYVDNGNEQDELTTVEPSPAYLEKDITSLESTKKIENAPNWYSMPGLGAFYSAGKGWIYQPEMGWCFTVVCQDECSVWVYSEKIGWMWLKSEIPNMTYTVGNLGQGWIFFPEESFGKCELVYSYSVPSWIKIK
jgi:subtilisin family serine protease